VRYWRHATEYYRLPSGQASGELSTIHCALRLFRRLYGRQPAASIGPLALKALQKQWVDAGASRSTANKYLARIKRLYRWAASEELLSAQVHQALDTVPGLRYGRTTARETEPVGPVADSVVAATLPFLPPIVADMVQLQRLTGARPGEICSIRPADVDTSTDVWVYSPERHKTLYRGHARKVFLGPRAQDVLRPYLLRPAEAFCFSPGESERKRRQLMREARKSKVSPSQQARGKGRPKQRLADQYGVPAYRRSIARGVDKANTAERRAAQREQREATCLEHWNPNQLRHTRATELRSLFGIEAARVTLGHRDPGVTLVYAEADLAKAADVARKTG